MDNLARDAVAATKAGMSYGQWKAQHPHTDPDKIPVVRHPKRVPNGSLATCPVCGREFKVTKDRAKFCSVECRNRRKPRV